MSDLADPWDEAAEATRTATEAPLSPGIESALLAYFTREPGDYDNGRLHYGSDLDPEACERKTWYRLNGAPRNPPSLGDEIRFHGGRVWETAALEAIEYSGTRVERQVVIRPLRPSAWAWVGHADALAGKRLLEIKAPRAGLFERAKGDPRKLVKSSYAWQASAYFHELKRLGRATSAAFLFLDREGSHRPVEVPLEGELLIELDRIIWREEWLASRLLRGPHTLTVPERAPSTLEVRVWKRPAEGAPAGTNRVEATEARFWGCSYCPFSATCQPGPEEQPVDLTPTDTYHVEAVRTARERWAKGAKTTPQVVRFGGAREEDDGGRADGDRDAPAGGPAGLAAHIDADGAGPVVSGDHGRADGGSPAARLEGAAGPGGAHGAVACSEPPSTPDAASGAATARSDSLAVGASSNAPPPSGASAATSTGTCSSTAAATCAAEEAPREPAAVEPVASPGGGAEPLPVVRGEVVSPVPVRGVPVEGLSPAGDEPEPLTHALSVTDPDGTLCGVRLPGEQRTGIPDGVTCVACRPLMEEQDRLALEREKCEACAAPLASLKDGRLTYHAYGLLEDGRRVCSPCYVAERPGTVEPVPVVRDGQIVEGSSRPCRPTEAGPWFARHRWPNNGGPCVRCATTRPQRAKRNPGPGASPGPAAGDPVQPHDQPAASLTADPLHVSHAVDEALAVPGTVRAADPGALAPVTAAAGITPQPPTSTDTGAAPTAPTDAPPQDASPTPPLAPGAAPVTLKCHACSAVLVPVPESGSGLLVLTGAAFYDETEVYGTFAEVAICSDACWQKHHGIRDHERPIVRTQRPIGVTGRHMRELARKIVDEAVAKSAAERTTEWARRDAAEVAAHEDEPLATYARGPDGALEREPDDGPLWIDETQGAEGGW